MNLAVFKETEVRLPMRQMHRLFQVVVEGEGGDQWPATVNLVMTDNPGIRRLNNQLMHLQSGQLILQQLQAGN